jgi:hypothetical protein
MEARMNDSSLLERLRKIIEEQPSYVGELAYSAEEDLSRSFGKLRCAAKLAETPPEEVLKELEAFGEALRQVEDRCSRVSNYYRQLLCAARTSP